MPDFDELFDDFKKEYSKENIKADARSDADKGQPSVDIERVPLEDRICAKAQNLIDSIYSPCVKKLQKIEGNIRAREDHVKKEYSDRKNQIEANYKSDLEKLDKSAELSGAQRAFDETKDRFDRKYADINRLPIAYIPHWLYVLFALVICIGEIPLNALIFSMFGESIVMNYTMAAVVGIAIVMGAHFIGIKFREHGKGFSFSNAIKAMVILALIITLFYGIAIMRQVMLGEMKEDFGLTDVLVDVSFQFFWVNIAILFAAIIVSYLAHDSIPGYERLFDDYNRAKRRLHRAMSKKEVRLAKINQQHTRDLYKAERALNYGLEDGRQIRGHYDEILLEGQGRQREVKGLMFELVAIYRQENLAHRKDGAIPKAFNTLPEDKLDLTLLSLSERDPAELPESLLSEA